jgi:CPA3 family monovalent cation (K+ or Na+):proton (H+) antiporter-3 mnhD subunit
MGSAAMMRSIAYQMRLHYRSQRLRVVVCVLIVVLLGLDCVISHLVASGYEGSTVEDVSYGYVYSFGGRVGYIVPLAVASLIVTSEYQSGQIARSIVILRGRGRAFAANVVAATLAGSVLGALFATLAHLVSGAMFALNSQDPRLATSRHLAMYSGILALGVLWSAIGAGLAWLVRNQTAVIGGVLAFAIFIEPTISAAGNADPSVMRIVKWLPGPLNWAVSWPAGVGQETTRRAIGLAPGAALVVLAMYAGLFLVLSWILMRDRLGFSRGSTITQ